eukprot:gnl/TRDRNA2_/TRDRNA2_191452_c0_seq1.p1 gnl/TRDRNA2_/TRDRNA2_191452_c0~~gnl/TRDRNA2_/TRDRNA2_191452_c0_seq1.p1  ORF type:complete len:334 (+),score=66.27 gnl/TRDRNA2_/TRDRNA2_191452_c0_seq1:58-1059(+)
MESAEATDAAGSRGRAPPSAPIMGAADARVYIGNLSWETTWQDLKDHMRSIGEVARVDVFTDADGRSKGCGIVAYRSADDAQRAIEELQDTDFMGRRLFLREDRETGPSTSQSCRVYVGNLAWGATWKELKDHFKKIGEVVRADVMCEGNVEGGRSKGYGIVEFRTPEEVAKAIETMEDTEILGRKIFVREDRESTRVLPTASTYGASWSGGKGGRYGDSYGGKGGGYPPMHVKAEGKGKGGGKSGKGFSGDPATKVFVGNLAWHLAWQDVKDHMRTVGDVAHVEIAEDKETGQSKGHAVVEFATYGAASRAIKRLHDSMLGGRMILVREYRA